MHPIGDRVAGLLKAIPLAAAVAMAIAPGASLAEESSTAGKPCRVVEKDSSDRSSSGPSVGITAGGGRVSGSTTMPRGAESGSGGKRAGVTVRSQSSGSSSAAVASNGQVAVMSGGGDCVVTVEPRR